MNIGATSPAQSGRSSKPAIRLNVDPVFGKFFLKGFMVALEKRKGVFHECLVDIDIGFYRIFLWIANSSVEYGLDALDLRIFHDLV